VKGPVLVGLDGEEILRVALFGAPGRTSVEYIVRRDERPPSIRYVLGREAHRVNGDLGMRVLGLVQAAVLALAAPMAAHAAPLGSNMGAAGSGPAPGAMRVGNIHGAQWLPAPGGRGGGWHPPHWDRAVSVAGGVPIVGRELPPTGSGVPAAALLIIPSQIGEARAAAGVIRSCSKRG
jgi:hypothetical protein